MAVERISVGAFLELYPGFEFSLDEYIAAMSTSAENTQRLDDFYRAMAVNAAPSGGWQRLKPAFERGTRGVPAYAHIDWSRPDFFNDITLIDKNTLRQRASDFRSPDGDARDWFTRETSGTTGPPIAIPYTRGFGFDFHLFAEWKVAWLAGALADDVAERDVFGLALVDKKSVGHRLWLPPDNSRGLTLRCVYDEREPLAPRELHERLQTHCPALLIAKPNILASFARGVDWPIAAQRQPLRLIISGGADLDSGVRQRVERLLGAPVINAYGMTEFGVVASECQHQQGLHVYSHQVIAEVLCGGELRDAGEGELVLSSFGNPAMPLLRFKTGDLVELSQASCRCGRVGSVIRNISGRIVKNFRFDDGTEFAPTSFNDLFKHFSLREFRVTQRAIDRIEVEVQLLDATTSEQLQLEAIRRYVEAETRGRAQATVNVAHFEPDGKFQRYRTLL